MLRVSVPHTRWRKYFTRKKWYTECCWAFKTRLALASDATMSQIILTRAGWMCCEWNLHKMMCSGLSVWSSIHPSLSSHPIYTAETWFPASLANWLQTRWTQWETLAVEEEKEKISRACLSPIVLATTGQSILCGPRSSQAGLLGFWPPRTMETLTSFLGLSSSLGVVALCCS